MRTSAVGLAFVLACTNPGSYKPDCQKIADSVAAACAAKVSQASQTVPSDVQILNCLGEGYWAKTICEQHVQRETDINACIDPPASDWILRRIPGLDPAGPCKVAEALYCDRRMGPGLLEYDARCGLISKELAKRTRSHR